MWQAALIRFKRDRQKLCLDMACWDIQTTRRPGSSQCCFERLGRTYFILASPTGSVLRYNGVQCSVDMSRMQASGITSWGYWLTPKEAPICGVNLGAHHDNRLAPRRKSLSQNYSFQSISEAVDPALPPYHPTRLISKSRLWSIFSPNAPFLLNAPVCE